MPYLSSAITLDGCFSGVIADGCAIFKGVPYAKSPTGSLRFEPPVQAEAFEGVRPADTFPPIAMQHFTDPDGMYRKEFYSNPDFQFPVSEDCLYLNIWTPAQAAGENLPVAVWIHGGGLEHGFAAELEFDGEAYCRKGVILVTIAYRVNLFGFLYTEEQEAALGHSGNQGFLDQIAALKWVHENIRAFGGDPENITLMGQSAGAISTQVLCFSPLSSPYIKRAILQSGGGLDPVSNLYRTREQALSVTREVFRLCGVSSLSELKKLPAEFLLQKSEELMALHCELPFRPVIDGYVLPKHPLDMVKDGMLAKAPYIIGSTKDDLFIPKGASYKEGAFYRSALSYAELCCSIQYPPVYVYEFCRDLPGSGDGAFHSSELWYTFGTLNRCWRPMEQKDYELSEEMVTCWTNFMKTGCPNGTSVPVWAACTPENPVIRTFR